MKGREGEGCVLDFLGTTTRLIAVYTVQGGWKNACQTRKNRNGEYIY